MLCDYLARRDGWNCHWCERKTSRKINCNADLFATIEHLVRLADGGSNGEDNLVIACRKCNNTRHSPHFNPRVATPLDEVLLLVKELPPLSRHEWLNTSAISTDELIKSGEKWQ